MSFVYLVPVRLFLSSVAVLYHVNGQLQRAYFMSFVFFRFTGRKPFGRNKSMKCLY